LPELCGQTPSTSVNPLAFNEIQCDSDGQDQIEYAISECDAEGQAAFGG
jgi:hypothetical protein